MSSKVDDVLHYIRLSKDGLKKHNLQSHLTTFQNQFLILNST